MESKKFKNSIKPVKGMRDFGPDDVKLRKNLTRIIEKIFINFGGQPVETPVVENRGIVDQLYGDEFNKLVYEIHDNEKEKLILRYDLTVPFARYIVNSNLNLFKRYTIGKVYRKDQPQINKGRYREFYQCDFDIVGTDYEQNLQELEILTLTDEILTKILKDKFKIIINSRQVLYSILDICGVSNNLIRECCRAIDKMDKTDVKVELEKCGLDSNNIEKIVDTVKTVKKFKNNQDTINFLIKLGVKSLEQISEIVNNSNLSSLIFDPFLARGMDYYTGLVYEAVYTDKTVLSTSIAAGGRYDKLIEKLGGGNVPVIGVSFGLDRIVDVLTTIKKNIDSIQKPKVYVASVGKSMAQERIKLCLELRKAGCYAETNYLVNPKMRSQFKSVFGNGIPYMLVIGSSEIMKNTVQLKIVKENKQIEIPRTDILKYID